MNERPILSKNLTSAEFRNYYYLKQELIDFCRENSLPVSGGKPELADRIAYFLDTGKILRPTAKKKPTVKIGEIKDDTAIEQNIVFSEKHRAFFEERIGKGFSFNVPFQSWLKSNAGKTYADAVEAYYKIKKEKKTRKTEIGKQFEYNTYIRAFFEDNRGKSLNDAVKCRKYKKSLPGHNRYERSDLIALER